MAITSFGITGGEPFLSPHILPILEQILKLGDCLILNNGTEPLRNKMASVVSRNEKYPGRLTRRINLDYADAKKHDAN